MGSVGTPVVRRMIDVVDDRHDRNARGERRHEDLAVLEGVPDSVFASPEAVNILQYER